MLKTKYTTKYLIIFLLLTCIGCFKTPLQKAIEEVASDYEAKQPAVNISRNGHHITDKGVSIQNCYFGIKPSDSRGWDEITLNYTGTSFSGG